MANLDERVTQAETGIAGLLQVAEAQSNALVALGEKLDNLDGKVDLLAIQVGNVITTQRRITERLESVEDRLNAVDGRLNAVDGRLNAVDGRLNAVDGRLDALERICADVLETLSRIDRRLP